MSREYPILLAEYERRLEERVKRGEIVEETKKTYLRDANRLLEALVYSLPSRLLKAGLEHRGFRGQYDAVINDLKEIVRKIVVQVKSGKVSVKDIRELKAVVENQEAVIGVFITLENPTQPMVTEAVKAGYYDRWGQKYPEIQIRTIEELFQGKGIEYPRTIIDISVLSHIL